MQDSGSSARGIFTFTIGIVFAVFAVVNPVEAATAVSVDQVLPPQGESCAVLGATDIRTFIYDGALHSFEIGVSDPSYVAVAAQVGEQTVPFNQITRHLDGSGNLTLHVDVATTPLVSDTPVSITLMAVQQGNITCVATVSSIIAAQEPGTVPINRPAVPADDYVYLRQDTVHEPVVTSAPGQGPGQPATEEKPLKPVPSLVTATHALGDACKTTTGASKLWTVLLVLYAIFVALLAYLRRGHEHESPWSIPLTVLGFLGLLLLWYLSAACRTGAWAPISATIIACLGLIAMTFEEDPKGEVLLLKDSAKKAQ